ncbi:hypothetical protein CMUS01_05869 [Colletotrichum musicola]|uniref:Uncharacterized protein n=1 Tax=Colletotrichum musicola TaxID=2175873 RepID=A0A8H6KPU1_9PEZI|nr:hypothetical protein CMUS01_05869 [Colletotrichum musicola]
MDETDEITPYSTGEERSAPLRYREDEDLARNISKLTLRVMNGKMNGSQWGPNSGQQVMSRIPLSVMQPWSEAPHGMIG